MTPKEIKYNLYCDDVWGYFLRPPHGTTPGLPLETKNTYNHENRRLGLIESLHMQLCSKFDPVIWNRAVECLQQKNGKYCLLFVAYFVSLFLYLTYILI